MLPALTDNGAISRLLRAVAAAMAQTPSPSLDGDGSIDRYLGDVVTTSFSGNGEQQVALLARLLTLARTWTVVQRPDRDLPPYAWLRRLERPLLRWERDRRLGTANPRPRPHELDARVAMFSAAQGPDPVIGADTVALSVAELVAIHHLAGVTSVEEGIAARAAITPVLEAAAALLEGERPAEDHGLFRYPGATLAHLDQATWQIEQILRHGPGQAELPWLRDLWLEVAAALVFAHDRYEQRRDHAERWRAVQDLAAEKVTVGGLLDDPATFDAHSTLALVRSVGLAFAAMWLDEVRDGRSRDLPGVPMLDGRLTAAAAQAVIAAWAADPSGEDGSGRGPGASAEA